MTVKDIFRKNLTHLMSVKNITQSDIAKNLNISSSCVSHWCLGITMPRGKTLLELADFFGVSPSTMLGSQNIFSTIDEEKLLIAFRSLSPTGKEKALERMYELAQIYWYDKEERIAK